MIRRRNFRTPVVDLHPYAGAVERDVGAGVRAASAHELRVIGRTPVPAERDGFRHTQNLLDRRDVDAYARVGRTIGIICAGISMDEFAVRRLAPARPDLRSHAFGVIGSPQITRQ
jgi:hypothetical protein